MVSLDITDDVTESSLVSVYSSLSVEVGEKIPKSSDFVGAERSGFLYFLLETLLSTMYSSAHMILHYRSILWSLPC